jgi:hypothetical protein
MIFGDFNLNLLSQAENVFKYQNSFALNGFSLLNNLSESFATRLDSINNTCSIIDHALTDLHLYHEQIDFTFHLFQRFADHKSILLSIEKKNLSSNVSKRPNSFKLINHGKIIQQKLFEELSPSNFVSFLEDIKKIVDSNSMNVSQIVLNRKPYINYELINLMTIRDNYYKIKVKYPHYSYASFQYTFYRNLVARKVKENKKKYLDTYFQTNANDPHKLWSQFKNLLFNSYSTKSECELILNNGIPISDKKVIADCFNNYFISKIHNLVSSQHLDDSDFHTFHSYEQYDIFHGFTNPICTEDEIALIIDNLSNSKAIDYYGISNNFVKLHKVGLIKNLTSLINNILQSGVYPDCFKIGIVSPIHKSGSKIDVKNYRPITVLPIFSKILDYVIKRRLDDHLEANKIIAASQFGYTKFSNTELAVAHILNDVYRSVDIGNATALTCLDLSSAFDCVVHTIMINKLRKLSLTKSFLDLFISFFNNRTQIVKISNQFSNPCNVVYGVAQGGVFSGTLFNLYINGINLINLNSSIFLYCDDISLVTSTLNPTTLKQQLEEDLSRISVWLKFHFLFPNETKTKYLMFHNKRRHENFYALALNIRFNSKVIERVEHTKLLGLELDETLSFSNHIYLLQKKIVAFMFALKRIRSLISQETASVLYFAYIHSRLSYMNCIWAPIPKYLMDSLEIIQRKALRIVLCKDKFSSRNELYSEKILPVSVQCQLSSAILTFKIINNTAKINFQIPYANQRHNHATRNANNILIPRTATQLGASNFFVRAFNDFNAIPTDIKKFVSINLFKSRFREHLYIKQLWYET